MVDPQKFQHQSEAIAECIALVEIATLYDVPAQVVLHALQERRSNDKRSGTDGSNYRRCPRELKDDVMEAVNRLT